MHANTKIKIAAAVVAVGLGATAVLAQERQPETGMMQGDMMPMMGMMEQMTRMMANCNAMMEAAPEDREPVPAPAQPETPQ